jgi:hypothetical protein
MELNKKNQLQRWSFYKKNNLNDIVFTKIIQPQRQIFTTKINLNVGVL